MKRHLALVFALLLVCTGAVMAQTPDGDPPSSETICDAETGAAWGLCNAYCEAMDCDSDDPSASETACGKVQSKFENITGRDLPCEKVLSPCPCANLPGLFADYLSGQRPIGRCFSSLAYACEAGLRVTAADGNENMSGYSLQCSGQWYCGAVDGGLSYLFLSPEQGQACLDLLTQAAADQGVIPCP